MKIEMTVMGEKTAALLAAFVPQWTEAYREDREADEAAWESRFAKQRANSPEAEPANTKPEAPAPEPKKRGRPAKTAAEPEPLIRTAPEAREPVPDAEIVDETPPDANDVSDIFDEGKAGTPKVYTIDDAREALSAYAGKHGHAFAQANAPGVMGYPKLSAIPNDPAAYEKVVRALRAAT